MSFDDCDLLTSSFGWIGVFEPISPPAISIARFEMTSLAFMLVCVPEPVCQTRSGKCASKLTVDHLVRRLDDQLHLVLGQLAEIKIDDRRRLFQNAQAPV